MDEKVSVDLAKIAEQAERQVHSIVALPINFHPELSLMQALQ